MTERIGYGLMFVAGLGFMVAVLCSLAYHRISNFTESYWELKRKLALLEEDKAGAMEFYTEEQYLDEIAKTEVEVQRMARWMVVENALRRIGLVLLYVSTVAGALGLLLEGVRVFR